MRINCKLQFTSTWFTENLRATAGMFVGKYSFSAFFTYFLHFYLRATYLFENSYINLRFGAVQLQTMVRFW